jgi:hypothetical protein
MYVLNVCPHAEMQQPAEDGSKSKKRKRSDDDEQEQQDGACLRCGGLVQSTRADLPARTHPPRVGKGNLRESEAEFDTAKQLFGSQSTQAPRPAQKKRRILSSDAGSSEMSEQPDAEDSNDETVAPESRQPSMLAETQCATDDTSADDSDNSAERSHKPCHCQKSRCLKLYCDCFARKVCSQLELHEHRSLCVIC